MMDFVRLFRVLKKELGPIDKIQKIGSGKTRER